MSKVIDGVPEYISDSTWLSMIRTAGFDPERLRSLELTPDGIYAEVFDCDPDGTRVESVYGGNVTNRVFVPVCREDS